jgi:hypothetical protein
MLLIALSSSSASCEVATRVQIQDDPGDPIFKLSGSGYLGQFTVFGPSPNLHRYERGSPEVWQLNPTDQNSVKISKLTPITYGKVPLGFSQTVPSDGPPPALLEGRIYLATGYTDSAQTGWVEFRITSGRAVTVASSGY